jgi:hypothetical protein
MIFNDTEIMRWHARCEGESELMTKPRNIMMMTIVPDRCKDTCRVIRTDAGVNIKSAIPVFFETFL